ncbi:MAG: hypothetical protein FD131_4732, partial [Rhodocyclaceae bacterium]
FLSRDPAGMADAVSPYAYVRNSPTNFVDPSGMLAKLASADMDAIYYGGGNRSVGGQSLQTMVDVEPVADGIDFSNGPVKLADLNLGMITVGVAGRVPFAGGGKASVGISLNNSKLDAGLIFEGDIPTLGAGKMLGKAAIEFGYQPGDFDSARGSNNVQLQGHYNMLGGSLSVDAKTNEFSGASVSIGPGLGVSVSGTRTNTISIRQFNNEVVQPIIDWLFGSGRK